VGAKQQGSETDRYSDSQWVYAMVFGRTAARRPAEPKKKAQREGRKEVWTGTFLLGTTVSLSLFFS